LKKLEKDKQKLNELLETKNIPKPTTTEAPKIKEESLPNFNKKQRTDVPIDNEKDAYLFKKSVTTTTTLEDKKEKKDDKDEQSKQATKKVIPVTEVFNVKTKKHRGINTIDELEKKTGGSPKGTQNEQNDQYQGNNQYKDNKQGNSQYKDNKQGNSQYQDKDNNQKTWDENKQGTQDENKQQRNRNDNYRGNNRDDNRDNRGQRNKPQKGVQFGRGRFNVESTDDFPSLSDNITEVPSKPIWLPNQTQQQL